MWIGECLDAVFEAGKIPLIAHPERYFCVQDFPEIVYEWLRSGCYAQMNKGSILGRFGGRVRESARILLENDLITCVASDAHRSYVRTPHMKEVRDHLTRNGGFEYTYHLLEGNPRRIISNRQIPAHGRRPERLRRYYW